ncbi:MAG TPA: VOC family protein [Acidimicrobiales bacterium]|nr:VOC family protein [Acidimicrobiales bacterium]
MELVRHVIVFDAADVAVESAFWAALFDGDVVSDDEEFHCVVSKSGEWLIGVQHAPNHTPPQWPDGVPEQQIHLDLHVEDPQLAHDEALKLGARVIQSAPGFTADEGHQVYVDPAGHPFCIGWGHPSPDALASFISERFGPGEAG